MTNSEKISKSLQLEFTKNFLTSDEHIDLLKKRGMNIINENVLKEYLIKFNYQNFVNGYNDLLFKVVNNRNNVYHSKINSNDLINIFNFSKEISSLILKNILIFEEQLSSYIIECIGNKLIKLNKNKNYHCDLFRINENDFKVIFSFAFKNNSNFEEEREKIEKDLKKYWILNNKNDLVIHCEKNKYFPIWSLSIYWSFGIIRNILVEYINRNILKEIKNKFDLFKSINVDEFNLIICILNKVRNLCSHNNVVYNFRYKLNEKQNFNKKYIRNKTKIYDVVVLLNKLKLTNENLIDSFENALNKNINNETSDLAKKRLLNCINYYCLNKKLEK